MFGKSSGNFSLNLVLFKGPRERVTPTNKNNAVELSTFEIIARVSSAEVQWQSLALEKLP